jgi:hypothetical protein
VIFLLAAHLPAAGGNWVTEGGKRFYSNPAQKPPSENCTDIAPDDRYNCEQQVGLPCGIKDAVLCCLLR